MRTRSRSGSFHAAALPSNPGASNEEVNSAAGTIVVFAVRPIRPKAASTRSSANRGCPGAFVNGGQAVETSVSGACAAATRQMAAHGRISSAWGSPIECLCAWHRGQNPYDPPVHESISKSTLQVPGRQRGWMRAPHVLMRVPVRAPK